MLERIISLAAFAAVSGILLVPSAAEAGSRRQFCFPFFLCHDSSQRDFYAGDDGDEEYYEDDERPMAYYDPDDEYYERGYEGDEPVYIAPKKKKTAKKAKPVEKKSIASTKKKVAKASVASVEKNAVSSTEKKTASATGGVSCNNAGAIVAGYGFTSVKPTACTGQVYAFNATRSGKAYVIKLSSVSGELTEVRKVQ